MRQNPNNSSDVIIELSDGETLDYMLHYHYLFLYVNYLLTTLFENIIFFYLQKMNHQE